MTEVILNKDDPELISECCWAIQRIFNDRRISATHLINQKLCERMVLLLKADDGHITTPILKAITNILSTEDDQPTQFFIERGLLNELFRFLDDGACQIKLESLFVLSNIAAGTTQQIQTILDHSFIHILTDLMMFSPDPKLSREACWTLSNLIKGGSVLQVRYLLSFLSLLSIHSIVSSQDELLILVYLVS